MSVLRIVADRTDPVLAFAADEAARFLTLPGREVGGSAGQGESQGEGPKEVRLELAGPPGAPATARVRGRTLTITGATGSDVLLALYTFLEHTGVCFDIRGPVLPETPTDWLDGLMLEVRPVVARRGIRQHINFPMDISSYPLEEALEYIRNVARLRLNHMTFHSYPQQWYVCPLPGRPPAAGRFFYDLPLPVPGHLAVRNRKHFCIPEIEPVFDDRARRSDAAIAWLQSVLRECKRCGMTVQFSLELRSASVEEAVAICRHVAEIYPQIDTLELITQECGASWGKSGVTRDQLARLIAEHFGPAETPGVRENLADGMGQLVLEVKELARALQVVAALGTSAIRPKLALGIYASDHPTLRVLLALLRQHAPRHVSWAFLPAHAGRAVAESVRAMQLTRDDLARTMLYSWIEFDGTMYLQQNGLTGIRQLLEHAVAVMEGAPVPGIAFNHWRTAENRLAARYAAEACLHGPLDVDAFTRRFAGRLGIADPALFAAALQTLDDVDTQARNDLPNVGFCYEGCWRGEGLGTSGRYRAPVLAEVSARYQRVREDLAACLASTARPAGRDYLEFLINRVECSVLHLRAILRLAELQTVYRPSGMTEAELAAGRRLCDEALAWAGEYMAHHARQIVDRGCEGTLISYYHVIPVTIRRLRGLFAQEAAGSESPAPADAPPPPAIG